jgi:hypothetical protein
MGGFQGKTSGSSIQRKMKMLKAEGIEINDGKIENFDKILFRFSEPSTVLTK